jgi:hypothetical protein
MKKRTWQFVTVGDMFRGTMIVEDPIDAETALIEARLSLGAKVQRVF